MLQTTTEPSDTTENELENELFSKATTTTTTFDTTSISPIIDTTISPSDNCKEEAIRLALKYNFVTDVTSMVVEEHDEYVKKGNVGVAEAVRHDAIDDYGYVNTRSGGGLIPLSGGGCPNCAMAYIPSYTTTGTTRRPFYTTTYRTTTTTTRRPFYTSTRSYNTINPEDISYTTRIPT